MALKHSDYIQKQINEFTRKEEKIGSLDFTIAIFDYCKGIIETARDIKIVQMPSEDFRKLMNQ